MIRPPTQHLRIYTHIYAHTYRPNLTNPIPPSPPTHTHQIHTQVIHYSYREQAAYLTILYLALIAGIAYFLLRYANRSLFKWHTVRFCDACNGSHPTPHYPTTSHAHPTHLTPPKINQNFST